MHYLLAETFDVRETRVRSVLVNIKLNKELTRIMGAAGLLHRDLVDLVGCLVARGRCFHL